MAVPHVPSPSGSLPSPVLGTLRLCESSHPDIILFPFFVFFFFGAGSVRLPVLLYLAAPPPLPTTPPGPQVSGLGGGVSAQCQEPGGRDTA